MKIKLKIWMFVIALLGILAVAAVCIFIVKDKSMTVQDIDGAVKQFGVLDVQNSYVASLDSKYLEPGAEDYIEVTGETTISVNISKEEVNGAGLRVAIIPAPDFLNNQIYYFNKYGSLMMYESESMGVGGSIKYYFSNRELIKEENNLEAEIEVKFESEKDILRRADNIYDSFATKILSK